ncbi:HVO_A0556 family zinc finger protein [Natrononativus amylolyticus]|uniref:HVO_A0556 family zinc finger protein n=1 Tax=Natrononativus amylolyticus TaxID=2963434 RepID=UPI0020CC272A|nr:HVO_A0556 family zinc finger protein [Natrononativus amylolyticus]
MAKSRAAGQRMLTLLEGRPCGFCADGTLVQRRYKGNRAVVCDRCETPQIQLW